MPRMPADRDVMRAPKGMLDVLPPDSARWIEVVARFAARAERFGYGLLLTPIVEHYEVFARVGETTDVVRKEMYDFVDRGGRRLALRPEGTAPVVRAFVQHRPPTPWKVWYLAPNFRAEQPQAGRYRQHWQLGAEVIGIDDPDVDVEIIELLWGFCRDLGLRDVRLLVNSMGDAETRARYREVLLAYWHAHAELIGAEMERAEANPLRILDSKRPDWIEMLERAPQLGEYLSDASAEHFARVQEGLQRARHSVRDRAPARARLRLLHGNGVRARERRARRRAERDRWRRSLRQARAGDGRARRRRRSDSVPASSDCCSRATPKACSRCRRRGSTRSSSISSASPTPRGCSPSCASRGSRPTGRTAAGRRRNSSRRPIGRARAGPSSSAPTRCKRGVVAVKDLRSDQPQSEVRREEIAAWLRTRKDEAPS